MKKKVSAEVKTMYGTYRADFTPVDDGHYLIRVPKRPDIVSQGKGLSDAKRLAREAIECSLMKAPQMA